MPPSARDPTPPPPEVQTLIDEALGITGGDMDTAIDLVVRKVLEDEGAAVARGALFRWVRREFQHRKRAP